VESNFGALRSPRGGILLVIVGCVGGFFGLVTGVGACLFGAAAELERGGNDCDCSELEDVSEDSGDEKADGWVLVSSLGSLMSVSEDDAKDDSSASVKSGEPGESGDKLLRVADGLLGGSTKGEVSCKLNGFWFSAASSSRSVTLVLRRWLEGSIVI
jgi:hypothetical protein